jgi:hypothetical protein
MNLEVWDIRKTWNGFATALLFSAAFWAAAWAVMAWALS